MESSKNPLSPMIRKDLVNLSNMLPYTGQDHMFNLVWHYERRRWDGVDEYIDIVQSYVHIAHKSNGCLWDVFIKKTTRYITSIINELIEAHNAWGK